MTTAAPASLDDPVFIGSKLNPKIVEWLDTHPFFYLYNKKTDAFVLAPDNERRLEELKQVLRQLGKLYGYDLVIESTPNRLLSSHAFGFSISYPIQYQAKYFETATAQRLLTIHSQGFSYPNFSDKYPDLKTTYDDFIYIILAECHFSAPISREAFKKSLEGIRPVQSLYSVSIYLKELATRWKTIQKKQRIPVSSMPVFMRAVEMYCRYAKNNNLPTNRLTHIANAIKAGMTAEAAVWLASNNIPSAEAKTLSTLPFDWLEALESGE